MFKVCGATATISFGWLGNSPAILQPINFIASRPIFAVIQLRPAGTSLPICYPSINVLARIYSAGLLSVTASCAAALATEMNKAPRLGR